MTREERLAKELEKCRDLLEILDDRIGTFTELDLERDIGKGYLDDVTAALISADEALKTPAIPAD